MGALWKLSPAATMCIEDFLRSGRLRAGGERPAPGESTGPVYGSPRAGDRAVTAAAVDVRYDQGMFRILA